MPATRRQETRTRAELVNELLLGRCFLSRTRSNSALGGLALSLARSSAKRACLVKESKLRGEYKWGEGGGWGSRMRHSRAIARAKRKGPSCHLAPAQWQADRQRRRQTIGSTIPHHCTAEWSHWSGCFTGLYCRAWNPWPPWPCSRSLFLCLCLSVRPSDSLNSLPHSLPWLLLPPLLSRSRGPRLPSFLRAHRVNAPPQELPSNFLLIDNPKVLPCSLSPLSSLRLMIFSSSNIMMYVLLPQESNFASFHFSIAFMGSSGFTLQDQCLNLDELILTIKSTLTYSQWSLANLQWTVCIVLDHNYAVQWPTKLRPLQFFYSWYNNARSDTLQSNSVVPIVTEQKILNLNDSYYNCFENINLFTES